ncbi:MAG: holo-ACP synthase [Elusimicrobiota bacterium]
MTKIIGTGVDIVEIRRIREMAKKNPRFLKRVFSAEEVAYAYKGLKWAERLAVRFAAKEAVWKALGHDDVALSSIAVTRMASGKPTIDLSRLKVPKNWVAEVALSHCDEYAIAHCIIYER